MEGRGILAEILDRETTVWASTQKPHELRGALADYIALDESRLRVVVPDVGGGFGPKLCVYPEDVAVVAAARLVGRSIKWIEDRREHFTNSVHERDQYWSIELAADVDGRVRGIRGRLIHDIGAYALQDVNIPYNSATTLTGPYIVPALAMDVVAAHTNKTPVSSVRGAGYPQAACRRVRASRCNMTAATIPAARLKFFTLVSGRTFRNDRLPRVLPAGISVSVSLMA
jgi:carbon-monoxide dehydrogenase large subunit